MLKGIGVDEIKGLVALTYNRDFQSYIKRLKEQEVFLSINSTKRKDDIECRWFQGAAQVVGELIDEIEKAKNQLTRIEQLNMKRGDHK